MSGPTDRSLRLTAITEEGRVYETGRPVQFPYVRNPAKAPNCGCRYGQDIEPAGRYMLTYNRCMDRDHLRATGWESGTIAFRNPLVIEWTGYGPDGWKARLSKAFGNRKGLALSRALLRAGHDGIVTVGTSEESGQPTFVREVVDLSVVR